MTIKVSCIGSGNMGFALLKGAASVLDPQNMAFADADKLKAEEAAEALGANVCTSNTQAVKSGDFVFLAVKPNVMEKVLKEISKTVKERLAKNKKGSFAIVSMAAGWSIKKIQSTLGVKAPIARIMPNTPALISKGLIAISSSPEMQETQLKNLSSLLSGAGMVDSVDEHYLDAITSLSGSGPAFAYIFMEALADGGVKAGLPRDKAQKYAAQTVMGAAAMILETGKHPGELKDMVASPAGTTIAGIAALEKANFRSSVISSVEAAWKRAVELSAQ